MLKRIVNYFSGIRPVVLDGAIYVMMAVTSANAGMLSSDNAAKYIDPEYLFYMLWFNIVVDGALLSLKMYRSTAYADHKQKVKEETQFFNKQNIPKP